MRLDEKLKPIPWAERPTGALVGAGSHWPWITPGSSPDYFSKKCIILSVPVLHGNRTENLVMGSVLPKTFPVPVPTPFVNPIQTRSYYPKPNSTIPTCQCEYLSNSGFSWLGSTVLPSFPLNVNQK
jgi:hypothetical protein